MTNSCINIQYHSPNWLKDQLSIQVLQHAMNIVLIFFLILVLSDCWVLTQNTIQLELVRVSPLVIIFGRYVLITTLHSLPIKSSVMYRITEDAKLLNFFILIHAISNTIKPSLLFRFQTAFVLLFVASKITTNITKEFHIRDHRPTRQRVQTSTG